MEIGAVKQAFNNELILLKKNLNQAKTQIIHKLTRKAKQLTEKKGPDTLKEKYKRKAEFAVKEVLVLKKIKTRDVGRFIVTHTGKLQDYLNKPQINNDKACARILLHKAMQEKYKFIRNRFSNIPIKDLFMSRNERLKLKKEEKMRKKEKRDRKKAKGLVSAEGDWEVEDVHKKASKRKIDDENEDNDDGSDNDAEEDGAEISGDDMPENEDEEPSEQSEPGSDDESVDASVENALGDGFKISFKGHSDESDNKESDDEMDSSDNKNIEEEPIPTKLTKKDKKTNKSSAKESIIIPKDLRSKPDKIIPIKLPEPKLKQIQKASKAKKEKKQKDITKNKNLQDKIVNKKFKKDSNDAPDIERKVVDPFFVTSTGENYMSIVEPRQPDEVKEIHKQGNRKLRRAVMFGHAPKIKPRQEFKQDKFNKSDAFDKTGNKFSKFDKPNGFPRPNSKINAKSDNDNRFNKFDNNKQRFNERNDTKIEEDVKPEKLHPSWEAKKKQSGILPFQGKKIVFDDS